MKTISTNLIIFLLTYSISWSQIPAFPGAEGFGSHTAGGRGGMILKVTNLNDSGPGSLRDALLAEGPRTIIFTTGGIIDLKTKLIIKNPFVTVAGQTAPGDGICIRGEGIRIYTHDVIIRYIRVRPGDIDFGPPNSWGGLDAITIADNPDDDDPQVPHNIIIDHCSLSWAIDEVIDMWHNTHDVTIQYCIISEGLHESKHPSGPHSKGMLIGSWATNISVHHNLFSSNFKRNPLINGESLVDFRNNIIYNYGKLASHVDRYSGINVRLNYVNNYIKAGPNSINKHALVMNERMKDRVKLYMTGNRTESTDQTDDNWSMVSMEKDDGEIVFISRNHTVDQEFQHPPTTTHSATRAYQQVLDRAGANLPRQDPIDKKVISDVKQRLGTIVNTRSDLLNWPSYRAGAPLPDHDDDGMPDYWENMYGLNSKDASDASSDRNKNGYTNLEDYLNNNTMPTASFASAMRTNSTTLPDMSPLALDLKQNYPNPFKNSTNLVFEIDSSSYISIQILNSQGETVGRLINSFMYEGNYEVNVDTRHLIPGIYCFVLASAQGRKIVKAIKR